MINFIYTIIICLYSCFGWYDLADSVQQRQIDAQNKNAIVYSEGTLLSLGDLLDENRFIAFMDYLESQKGTEFILENTWSTTLIVDAFNDAYAVNISLQSSTEVFNQPVYYWNVDRVVVTKTIVPPANDKNYKHQFDFYFYTQDPLIFHYAVGYYSSSSTAFYHKQIDYLSMLYFCDILEIYNDYLPFYSYGVFFKSNTTLYRYFTGYYVPSTEEAIEQSYDLGYNNGFNDGYDDGLVDGESNGYDNGYNAGNTAGFQTGYNAGLTDGQNYDQTALTIFTGIIEVGLLPVNIFLQMFNYEIFGINISGIVSSLLTISIVIIIVRFLLGKKDD